MLYEFAPNQYVNPSMVTTVAVDVRPAEEDNPAEFVAEVRIRSACGATNVHTTYHHDENEARHAAEEVLNHLRFAMSKAVR